MNEAEKATYRFVYSVALCLVLAAVILATAIFLAGYLEAEIFDSELPDWLDFVFSGTCSLLVIWVVLVTVDKSWRKLEEEMKKIKSSKKDE